MKTIGILAFLTCVFGLVSGTFGALAPGWSASGSGSANYENGVWTFTVTYGIPYQRHFVYTPVNGSCRITARVRTHKLRYTSGTGHFGVYVAILENSKLLNPRPRGVMVGTGNETPGNAFIDMEDYQTNHWIGDGSYIELPYWIRIERVENSFIGYASPSGEPDSWTEIGSIDIPMNKEAFVGLFVCCDEYEYGEFIEFQAEVDNVMIDTSLPGSGWRISDRNMYSAVKGNVGIGTQYPLAKLHVSNGNILLDNDQYLSFVDVSGYMNHTLKMDHNNDVVLLNFSGGNIVFGTSDTLGQSASRMTITKSGNVGIGTTEPKGRLDVIGSIYQRGSQLHADYVFGPDYELETIEEHSHFMWKHHHLQAIPKAQFDAKGQEIVEVGAHQRGIVEELEKAHIYIEQLDKRIKELEEKLAKLEAMQIPEQ